MADLAQKISSRTRVVAVGYASNAVGTINDVKEIVRLAHTEGALAYIDAVHYAPHGPIDVRALDCDFLVCSSYKFFGPHMGILYGKREHLQRLQPYKVRANTNAVPNRWEWGTLNHECIAGITACVDYLADLGRQVDPSVATRRAALLAAYGAIQQHEHALAETLISGLLAIPGLKFYGIRDLAKLDRRCPTVAVRIAGHTPLELATKLGERGFFTWDGNYYALNLTERLDVEKDGGFLRIGLAHYNTAEEVQRFLSCAARDCRLSCLLRWNLQNLSPFSDQGDARHPNKKPVFDHSGGGFELAGQRGRIGNLAEVAIENVIAFVSDELAAARHPRAL